MARNTVKNNLPSPFIQNFRNCEVSTSSIGLNNERINETRKINEGTKMEKKPTATKIEIMIEL
mgnify:CR=1 FL=1